MQDFRLLLLHGLALVGVVFVGCRAPRRQCSPVCKVATATAAPVQFDSIPCAFETSPSAEDLTGPTRVEEYIAIAVAQNPDIQAARHHVAAMTYRVPQATSLQDPLLNVMVPLEQVQTAAGAQELALSASQKIPWHSKLHVRGQVARSEVRAARANLAVVELEVVEQVKRAYFELYYLQFAGDVTRRSRESLVTIWNTAKARFEGEASAQDVLRVQVQIMQLDAKLVQLDQQRASTQTKLARLMQVAPDTVLATVDDLPPEQVVFDLERLYSQAVSMRPELRAQLAVVTRDRQSVELARMEYLPDPTFSATWIDTSNSGLSPVANGRDTLLLGVGVNLPINRHRLRAGLREAQSQAMASSRQHDSLRDKTLESVRDLFLQAQSQRETLKLFRENIVPTAERTLRVSIPAYKVGDIDIGQLLDNWQQVLTVRLAEKRSDSELRQTLASLERVVGGPFETTAHPDSFPLPEPAVE